MLHTFITTLTGLLGHLIGDPVHTISATALKVAMDASAALHKQGAISELGELTDKVDSMVNAGRAVTEQEWKELQSLAEKHITAMKEKPVEVPPVPASSDTPSPPSVSSS